MDPYSYMLLLCGGNLGQYTAMQNLKRLLIEISTSWIFITCMKKIFHFILIWDKVATFYVGTSNLSLIVCSKEWILICFCFVVEIWANILLCGKRLLIKISTSWIFRPVRKKYFHFILIWAKTATFLRWYI
jgi:hypothetical protein